MVVRSSAIAIWILLAGAVCISGLPALAQAPCPAAPSLPAAQGKNIFTPQQEADLGDVVAEHIQHEFRVIDDEEVTTYLTRVANRILKQMPATQLRFQVFLFDLPVANAFSLPGGRIYISREMVAFVRTEDELAGLLGHEMGHILTHQGGADTTRLFHEVLGVNEVGDRRDIFDKYNRLLENRQKAARTGEELEKKEEPAQYQADQVALYTVANAGYAPQALVEFWDRFAQTKGKTGSWFSNLFGVTKPEEKRLREMRKALAGVPAGCLQRTASAHDDFLAWQSAVIGYAGLGHRESLHNVLAKEVLDPPLRSDITHLRFSPDGRYIVAQDDASIFVLSREPFALLFRIDAKDAYAAQFTPDSNSVVFYTPGLRVEEWSVTDESRTGAHELVVREGCMQTSLAPDGKTLACLDHDFNLSLIQTSSGTAVYTKKSAFTVSDTLGEDFLLWLVRFLATGEFEWAHMAFSPDGHYFVAAKRGTAFALDVATHTNVPIHGELKSLLAGGFAFLGPDRLIGINGLDSKKAAVVKFPSGEVLEPLELGGQHLEAATHGNYVLLRPIRDYPLGVMDLTTKKLMFANRTSALDLYDNVFVDELRDGHLGLYDTATRKLLVEVNLPQSPLGRLFAADLSPDLRWLALSGRNRGAVWNLVNAKRMYYLRSFHGAYFGGGQALYADFPKNENSERAITRLNLMEKQVDPRTPIADSFTEQYGRFLVTKKPAKKGHDLTREIVLEVSDVSTGNLLWSATFPREAPSVDVDSHEGAMVLAWSVDSGAARDEVQKNSSLQERLAHFQNRKMGYLLEVIDAMTGKRLGQPLLVDNAKNSFRIHNAFATGDWVVLTDSENRTLLFSLSTGAEIGTVFGTHSTLSKEAGLLCVGNEPGQITLYALPSLRKSDQFVFSSPISLAQFSPDGKKLFVLTESQTAYFLDVSTSARTASSGNTARP